MPSKLEATQELVQSNKLMTARLSALKLNQSGCNAVRSQLQTPSFAKQTGKHFLWHTRESGVGKWQENREESLSNVGALEVTSLQ